MATLDQLPAEQRAIVELVVQRGRSYDALADVLQVPADRVRELARDALSELSPRTAARVDPEWRGQVADYLLGQQSSADARDTRGYLKRSETARAWALSLLDSLDPLYGNGGAPAVPEPEEASAAEEEEKEAPAAAPKRAAAKPRAAGNGGGETVEERARARARERKPERERERAREPERKREPLRKQPREDEDDDEVTTATTEPRRRSGGLSPAAEAALKRRRLIGAGIGALLLAGLVVAILAIAGVFSSDDDKGGKAAAKDGTTTPASSQQLQVLGQIPLNPVDKAQAQGVAYVVQQAGKRYLVVQAQVPPLPGTQKAAAYEVWLYNSKGDARSLGAQYTDKKGILQGRAELPEDFAKYKNVDVSRELFDKNAEHGDSSVLRGAFASLQPVPQQQGQGEGGAQGGAGGAQGGAGGTQAPGGTPTTPAAP